MTKFPRIAYVMVDFVDHKIMSYNKSSAFKWFENDRSSTHYFCLMDFVDHKIMSYKEFGIHGLKMTRFPRITFVMVDFVDHTIMSKSSA